MIRLAALLACLAGPAAATQDGWPALFDVKGVASNDTLNIRSEPGTGGAIIGTIPPDAEGIEVVRPNERQTWGLVNHGEATGWVSLSFLERRPGQWWGHVPQIRSCFGTEPFWSLSFDDDAITWSTPEETATGQRLETWSTLNSRDLHAFSLRITSDDGSEREGVAMLSLDSCNDGMSNREYGLRLDLLLGGADERTLLSGCCSIQPPDGER